MTATVTVNDAANNAAKQKQAASMILPEEAATIRAVTGRATIPMLVGVENGRPIFSEMALQENPRPAGPIVVMFP